MVPPKQEIKKGERTLLPQIFRGDEELECPVLRVLELTADDIVRWGALGSKMTSFDKAQVKGIAELEKRAENFERQPADPRSAPRKDKSPKREKLETGKENSGGTSIREVSRPRLKTV